MKYTILDYMASRPMLQEVPLGVSDIRSDIDRIQIQPLSGRDLGMMWEWEGVREEVDYWDALASNHHYYLA